MDKKKLFLLISLVVVAVIVVLSWFFINRALQVSPQKLSDKDFSKIEVRQENDKRFKEAKRYFEKNKDLTRPNQETVKHAALLANADRLETIYKNDQARGDKKAVKWDNPQVLVYASYYGKPELLKQLFNYRLEELKKTEAKKDSKAKKDKKYISIIHYAAGAGNMELVKYYDEIARNGEAVTTYRLKPYDVDIKACDARGWNVLHFAAASGNQELVKYLVEEKGFDVNGKNRYGQTALDYAKTQAVDKYLKEKGAKKGTELR